MTGRELIAVTKSTFHEFNRVDVPYMAAALTYYIFFSLFPLLLLGLIIVGALLDPQVARDFIFGQVAQVAPGLTDSLREILGEVLENRRSAGFIAIVGLITLLFAATGAFDALETAINRAWGIERLPNIIIAKLTSFLMMITIGGLLIVSLVVSAVLQGLQNLASPALENLPMDAMFWQVLNFIGTLGITVLAFTLLYRFVPRCKVQLRDVLPAALIASLIWTVAKEGFAYFLGSSLANFSAVYGAVSTVIALLLWIYASSVILITGAEFSSETVKVRQYLTVADKALSRPIPSPWFARSSATNENDDSPSGYT